MGVGRSEGRVGRAGLCILTALLLLGFSVSSAVGAEDIYTVTGVKVDRTAESVGKAREQALVEGQRLAFARLIRKIAVTKDVPSISDADMAALVRGFEVADEKTSALRYLASLTILFKKDAMREFLKAAGIAFSETRRKPTLVLPVLETGGVRILWEDPNAWRVAWNAPGRQDSLVPLVLPLGDLADVASIGAEQAIAGEPAKLEQVAARYRVDDVLVAIAQVNFQPGSDVPQVRVVVQRIGRSDDRTVVENFSGGSRATLDAVLQDIVVKLRDRLEEDWKRDTVLHFDGETQVSISVPLSDLQGWVSIRERIIDLPGVRRMDVAAINSKSAQIVLHFLGAAEQLRMTLSQKDLDLTEEEGYWVVRLRPERAGALTPAATQ